MIKYVPIIKTGDAELRVIKKLSSNIKNKIVPLFELTRGRKTKNDSTGNLEKRVKVLKEYYSDTPFILDLTSEFALSNEEIQDLHSSLNNYENWISYCKQLKNSFFEFYPVVQIEEEEDYNTYIQKLEGQIAKLCNNFKYIVFRASGNESIQNIISDIYTIKQKNSIPNLINKIIFIIDFKYINNSKSNIETAKIFINLLQKIGVSNIVISSTSTPAHFSQFMDADYKQFTIHERDFYESLCNEFKHLDLIYSDYASINPIRNDTVTITNGWIPRIDVPSKDNKIHSTRRRRGNLSYSDTYEIIAKFIVKQNFFNNISNFDCWGVESIIETSEGNVTGTAPSVWISVRMDIYINMIVNVYYGI